MASLLATATIHAQEFSGTAGIECSGIVHSDGDSDQSQGDADKAMPHHHNNCQSMSASLQSDADSQPLLRPVAITAPNYVSTVTHLWSNGPGLRPPIA